VLTEILFVIGCFALWMASGAMLLVKHKAASGKKTNIVMPVTIMAIAIIFMSVTRIVG
jgi:hypothetical protein